MILMILEASDLGSGQYEVPARGPGLRDRRGCWVVVLLGCQAGSGICRRRVNALARASAHSPTKLGLDPPDHWQSREPSGTAFAPAASGRLHRAHVPSGPRTVRVLAPATTAGTTAARQRRNTASTRRALDRISSPPLLVPAGTAPDQQGHPRFGATRRRRTRTRLHRRSTTTCRAACTCRSSPTAS